MFRFISFFIIGNLLFIAQLFSQQYTTQGNPYIQNYNDKNYNTPENQTWAIIQGHSDVMYFGNNSGVLEFDGNKWRLIEITNKSAVRSLAIDSTGRIFVGAVGEFGYLQADSTGSMQYVSLIEKIPEEERIFMDVWEIFITNESVIVKTSNKIFLIKNNKTKVFKSKNGFHISFFVNNEFFVREREKGLLKLVDDSLHFVLNSDQFANEPIYIMLPYEEDKILIATRKRGVFIFRPNKKNNPFSKPVGMEEVDNFLIKNQVYYGTRLNNKQFIFGTSQNGLIIIDKSGNILQHFNKDVGLQDIKILCVYVDSQKNIWAGLNSGISYIIMNAPLTLYNEKDGLFGSAYTATIYKGRLYAATSVGLFYKDAHNKFKVIENTKGQGWYLTEIQGELFFGHAEGVFIIKNNVAKKIVPNVKTIWNLNKLKNLSTDRQDKPYILAGHNTGLILLEFKNGNWVLKHKIKGFNKSAHIVQEDDNGDIWVSHRFNDVCRLRLNQPLDSVIELNYYNFNNGLPQDSYNFVFKIKTANQNTRILFGTKKGIYKFNRGTNRFIPDETFNKLFDKENLIDKFAQDANGNIYFQHGGEKGVLLLQADSTYILEKIPFFKFKDLYVEKIQVVDSINMFFCTEKGIIQYNRRIKPDYSVPYHVLIRQVFANSHIFNGTQKVGNIKELTFKQNNLQFTYSALYYEEHDKTQYSYFLEGFDKQWSEWTLKSEKEYTNLPKGNYAFRVKAKNIYSQISNEDSYRFVILTPWYLSILAYVIYVVLFIVLFIIAVKLNIKRLKAHNKHLERLVRERTFEITQQKEEISSQSENLLKANEELEKLSIAVSKTDNSIVIMDAKGNFEWVNDGFTRLYHLTFDEFLEKRGENILECSSNPHINEELNRCIFEKKTVSYEFFYLTESNEKIWTKTTITPILDDNNEVAKLIAIDSDITDMKLAEKEILQKNEEILTQKDEILTQKDELEIHRNHLERLVKKRTSELEKAKIKAEESDRLKSSFLANMSHEIRTPMNAIVGFTNLINDPETSSDQRKELSKLVIHNSDTLLRLIDDIIDIAKLETGQLIIRKQDFDLNNLLTKIFEIFKKNNKLINKDHLELIFDNNNNKEQFIIYSDPLRIQQVLSNLINNALKYTEKGSVEFGYKLDTNKKNPEITFYVKDTGIGLSLDQQKIIFSRFTKVEDNKKKIYRGAGLGLAISKNIIELLGGNIGVESELNNGSIFFFTIPLIKAKDLNESITMTKKIGNDELNYNWTGKTILIVEDEENNYRFFETILSKMQANILHARNGIEAIKICQEKNIDLVLMDIKLPEMDGLEATKIIKKENKDIPIIAVTAFAMENDEKMSLEAGCDSYMSKPVLKSDLLVMLNKFFI